MVLDIIIAANSFITANTKHFEGVDGLPLTDWIT